MASALNGPKRLLANPLYRLLAINFVIGAGVAALIVAGLLVTDAVGIGTLIAHTQNPVIAVVLLYGGFFITFTSVTMGCAIMLLPRDEEDDGNGGGHKQHSGSMHGLVLAPINKDRSR